MRVEKNSRNVGSVFFMCFAALPEGNFALAELALSCCNEGRRLFKKLDTTCSRGGARSPSMKQSILISLNF